MGELVHRVTGEHNDLRQAPHPHFSPLSAVCTPTRKDISDRFPSALSSPLRRRMVSSVLLLSFWCRHLAQIISAELKFVHSHSSSTEVKNSSDFTSIPPIRFRSILLRHRSKFTFSYYYYYYYHYYYYYYLIVLVLNNDMK
jgi:hypothetical protein